MSYDLTFLPKADDESWDEALEAAEARLEAEEEGAARTRPDPRTWARLVESAREVLGEVSVFDGPDHHELSQESSGIQLSWFGEEAAVTVPYWHTGDRAAAVMAQAYRLAERVEAVTGLRGYDPQLDLPVAEAAARPDLGVATFDRIEASFAGSGTHLGPTTGGAAPAPWWQFWRRSGRS